MHNKGENLKINSLDPAANQEQIIFPGLELTVLWAL